MESQGLIRIVKAMNLPKTELTSKIDGYVKVCQAGSIVGKTQTKDDNEDPVWEESFPIKVSHNNGQLGGTIELQLYDENTLKDKLVGRVSINMSTLTYQQLAYHELPVQFAEEKFASQGRDSRLGFSIAPGILTYPSMRAMWAAAPGALFSDHQQRVYIPFLDPRAGPLVFGIEYEQSGVVDFKVFVTVPGIAIHIDMFLAGRPKTKIRRRQYPNGHMVAAGLTAFQEIKMDDVPPTIDFNMLTIIVHDAAYITGTNAAEVVKAHGWAGALNFEKACKALHNIDVDHKEKEIYMTVDPMETMMLVDWDDDNVDIKLAVLSTPSTSDKAYDLTITGQDSKNQSEVFQPPKQALGGKYQVGRIYELDDVKYGSSLKSISIHRLQLSNMRTFTVQGLTRIMG